MPNPDGPSLLNHLIRLGEKRQWDFEAERFRGLEVDDKQELRGLLNRKIGRFGTFQDSIDVVGPEPSQTRIVRPIRK